MFHLNKVGLSEVSELSKVIVVFSNYRSQSRFTVVLVYTHLEFND